MILDTFKKWPDCYLHIRECRSGEEWAVAIGPRKHLDLKKRVKEWIKSEFAGECALDGDIMPRLEGDYYAIIQTDGRAPDSTHVWTSGGFFIKSNG